MDPRSWFSSLTGYFVYILSVATLGPLLFGFHLVCPPPPPTRQPHIPSPTSCIANTCCLS